MSSSDNGSDTHTQMKSVTIHVTEDDLKGDGFHSSDCPGFRATRRVIPHTNFFGFYNFSVTGCRQCIAVPFEAAEKLLSHARWQMGQEHRALLSLGDEATPFSFIVRIPEEVATI